MGTVRSSKQTPEYHRCRYIPSNYLESSLKAESVGVERLHPFLDEETDFAHQED